MVELSSVLLTVSGKPGRTQRIIRE